MTHNVDSISTEISDELHLKLDFDRSAKEYVVSSEEYSLVLDNINDDDVKYEVKSRNMELLEGGTLSGQKNHVLKIKWIPSVGDRQYVLVKYHRSAEERPCPMVGVCIQKIKVQ